MTFGSREFLGGPGDCLFLRILTAEYGGLKTRTYGHISEIWLTNPALLDSSLRWNDDGGLSSFWRRPEWRDRRRGISTWLPL